MENDTKFQISAKVVNTLAIIGFVALVGGGISLAVYGARFVPSAVSGLSSAAVSLSSLFVPNDEPSPVVDENLPDGSPAAGATTTDETLATATSTDTSVVPSPNPVTVTPQAGQETVTIDQTPTTVTPPALFGLPDLVTTIIASGYFTATSTTSLVATTTIPANAVHVVVRFKIQNKGTNVMPSGWAFTASLPTGVRTYTGQQSLLPGERIEYQIFFDRPASGTTPTVSVSADINSVAVETSEDNNTAATTFIIQ